jgi:SAM-dependent methyltransferase
MPPPTVPLSRQKREWEELASLDPLWSILADNSRKFGRWDLDEFFQTGTDEISSILANARQFARPQQYRSALDFGCGVGRLSRALKSVFQECVGVDISDAMIERARALNPACQFTVLNGTDLRMFPDDQFDFVYSNIVLQHQPHRAVVFSYIREFLRVVKPTGLIVFQLPHHVPVRHRLQPRRRTYRMLRSLHVPADFLYRRLGLNPITMLAISEEEVRNEIRGMKGTVLKVLEDHNGGPGIESRTYFVCA